MTSGLCTAAVTLTAAEIKQLEDLPHAVNEVPEADGCQHLAGHAGRHAFAVQWQDGDGVYATWWVVWDGPEQPDSTGYEIVTLEACGVLKPGDDLDGLNGCEHPTGHEGPHRWWH